MNIIKNRSNLLTEACGNSIIENKKTMQSIADGHRSYKNIFNKNILWVKLYDNYLYLYINKNSSVGNNKNVFTLLESTFLSMSSLISKPFIIITPNKVVIQLFYYLNNNVASGSNNKLLNINNDKLQSLCLILSKI